MRIITLTDKEIEVIKNVLAFAIDTTIDDPLNHCGLQGKVNENKETMKKIYKILERR